MLIGMNVVLFLVPQPPHEYACRKLITRDRKRELIVNFSDPKLASKEFDTPYFHAILNNWKLYL